MAGSSEKPTEIAKELFDAVSSAMNGAHASDPTMRDKLMLYGFMKLADGLGQLSIGLRATYMEVEELKRTIRFQSMARRP